jgi:hypothetical protein
MQDNNSPRAIVVIGRKIQQTWLSCYQWLIDTPERALFAAYQSAQEIKNIELEYFGGKKISSESQDYTETVMSYWQGSLTRNLFIIKVRLTEFKLSNNLSKRSSTQLLDKLNFIDQVISKYEMEDSPPSYTTNSDEPVSKKPQSNNSGFSITQTNLSEIDLDAIASRAPWNATTVIPATIGTTISRITQDFSNQKSAEAEFVEKFRKSRRRTQRAIRFLLILVIVPLLTQYLSQRIILNPVVEKIRGENYIHVFLNSDMEKEAFKELNLFQQTLKFDLFLHHELENKELEEEQKKIADKVKDKAKEIAEEFRHKSNRAISNVFADLMSIIAFAVIVFLGKKDIVFVKSLIDKIFYGLSNNAKAFVIILFTDMFVGFHSPHGWEVILEGFAEHLGLAANETIIFAFIATFPVILATIFKYWIFRYLSRLSPSALATLKEMDE